MTGLSERAQVVIDFISHICVELTSQ